MGDTTAISWADHTFNPWIGCIEESEGCRHCYARTLVEGRMGRSGSWGPAKTTGRPRTSVSYWRKALTWEREARRTGVRARVFCGSLCDWAEDHPDTEAVRPDLFHLIRQTPSLDWLLLTKRPGRLPDVLPPDWGSGWPNIWLGTSIEDMRVARRRDQLVAVPAAVHFISYEPALGSLDTLDLTDIEWLIVGGESGPHRRPMDVVWVASIVARCRVHGTAVHVKQDAALRAGQQGRIPDDLWIHEHPTAGQTTGAP